jgi:peptidyl-prolyl cis-trans isomerase A (cyclophilin A)
MRLLLVTTIVCSGLMAQPAATKSAPKGAATSKGSTASKGPAKSATNPALLNPAALKAKAPEIFKAQFTTTKGDFIVEVHRDWAPIGADRFYNLVKNGFYNDASFFRVVPGFVAQFGLSAKPAISKAWENAKLKDDPVKVGNKRGNLVYAMQPIPNTRTTQIFINFKDNSASLDSQGFAAFGSVIEGMDVVDRLYSGYGDNGPDQGLISSQGKPYLDKNFPKLDSVLTAKILPGAAPEPGPATKKTAPAIKKTAPATKKAPAPDTKK